MASGVGDSICETCRKIGFHDLLQDPREDEVHKMGKPSPYTMRHSYNCKICRFMFHNVPVSLMEKTFELRSYSFRKMSRGARKSNLDNQGGVLLKIGIPATG
ncbi:hypothetical protein G6011_11795 [Alternaria panax]|uniref:Uncharacterized protein n=1 Tax=Alternaria panax TaxID=48097 RepID=A0AAD4I0V3_9PLEO|nr:hypothetical protein G6011_11795 [Alternaria panax]